MGEFRISAHEKKALELALRDGTVRAIKVNNIRGVSLMGMVRKGWLKSQYDRQLRQNVYQLTDTGRTIAHQLGLGGAE